MKKQFLLSFALLISVLVLIIGCSKEYSVGNYTVPGDNLNLQIDFTPVVDTMKLNFDSSYTNYWNETYTVSTFKFYISGVDLIDTDSNRVYHVNPDRYFLIDAADAATWSIKLSAIPFRYNRIIFLIGVDSVRNVSGTQTGPLDPAKGMFWTWNSGYIMAKLEGHSPLSTLTNNKIEYHIGGFKGTENVLRKPALPLPNGQFSEIIINKKSTIKVNANVNAWFSNPHELKIAVNPSCTTPGILAKDISENYAKMFTVTTVTNH